MNDKVAVSVDGIKQIASNIDVKRQEIMNTFTSKILPVLNSSEECLKVSGLNYEEVQKSFNDVFNKLDGRLTDLSRALTDKIIPGYENASDVIRQMFNTEFAEELQKALSIMNAD